MAWSADKNVVFFQRAQAWAAAYMNLIEERNRLIDLYNNEAHAGGVDAATFVDVPAVALKADLVALATNVMTPMFNMTYNVAVTTASRVPYLTPFLANQG